MRCEWGSCNRKSTRRYKQEELCELHYLFKNQVERIERVNIQWSKINRYKDVREPEKEILKKFKPYKNK